jgi:hypothetical protein
MLLHYVRARLLTDKLRKAPGRIHNMLYHASRSVLHHVPGFKGQKEDRPVLHPEIDHIGILQTM